MCECLPGAQLWLARRILRTSQETAAATAPLLQTGMLRHQEVNAAGSRAARTGAQTAHSPPLYVVPASSRKEAGGSLGNRNSLDSTLCHPPPLSRHPGYTPPCVLQSGVDPTLHTRGWGGHKSCGRPLHMPPPLHRHTWASQTLSPQRVSRQLSRTRQNRASSGEQELIYPLLYHQRRPLLRQIPRGKVLVWGHPPHRHASPAFL